MAFLRSATLQHYGFEDVPDDADDPAPAGPDEGSPANDPALTAAWRRMQQRHRRMLAADAARRRN